MERAGGARLARSRGARRGRFERWLDLSQTFTSIEKLPSNLPMRGSKPLSPEMRIRLASKDW